MKRENIIIVVVIAIVLVLAIGYSIFNETLTIRGTVAASGSFDVEFTSWTDPGNGNGYVKDTTVQHNLAEISQDKNAVVINVNKLTYPGAYVNIPITITNVGALDATLNAINITGWNSESSPIKVTYSGVTEGESLAVGGSKVITVHVEWVSTNNTTTAQPANPLENPQFTITLDYRQATN